jgi:hypothetical protein
MKFLPAGSRQALLFFSVIFGPFVCVAALMAVITFREMRQTQRLIDAGGSFERFVEHYHRPQRQYGSFTELPEKFRRGVDERSNSVYYLFTREGMPYWYFVVGVDPGTSNVVAGAAMHY